MIRRWLNDPIMMNVVIRSTIIGVIISLAFILVSPKPMEDISQAKVDAYPISSITIQSDLLEPSRDRTPR